MGTRIVKLNATATGIIQIADEYGRSIEAPVIASNGGYTIFNHDGRALAVSDYGNGDAEYFEHNEGDTFDADWIGQYVVRDGEWTEIEGDAIHWPEGDMIYAACEHWGEGFDPADCRVIPSTGHTDRPCLVVLHEPTGRTSDEAGNGGRWETDGRPFEAD